MNFKYVMIDNNFPVIFHPDIDHKFFKHLYGKVTSAGFVTFEIFESKTIKCNVYGEALNIHSVEEDSLIISNYINDNNEKESSKEDDKCKKYWCRSLPLFGGED